MVGRTTAPQGLRQHLNGLIPTAPPWLAGAIAVVLGLVAGLR